MHSAHQSTSFGSAEQLKGNTVNARGSQTFRALRIIYQSTNQRHVQADVKAEMKAVKDELKCVREERKQLALDVHQAQLSMTQVRSLHA